MRRSVAGTPSDESCLHPPPRLRLFPLTAGDTAFVILRRRGPGLHISAYLYAALCIPTAAAASQAVSVRNEPPGTNRLAKYENWITIKGNVLLKCRGIMIVCTPRPYSPCH